MDSPKTEQAGLSIVEALLAVVVIGVLAGAGWAAYQHVKSSASTTGAASNSTPSTAQQKSTTTTQTNTDPYAAWLTFTDNASAGTSGISVKYPPNGQVRVGGSKVYAWSISGAHSGITARYVFLDNSWTARQEWEDCAVQISADACGAAPGDKTVTGSESTINGLDAYSATMQRSGGGTYHVTVIRGDRPTPPAGTPYVEFITDSTDQAGLNTFAKIVASATFPS